MWHRRRLHSRVVPVALYPKYAPKKQEKPTRLELGSNALDQRSPLLKELPKSPIAQQSSREDPQLQQLILSHLFSASKPPSPRLTLFITVHNTSDRKRAFPTTVGLGGMEAGGSKRGREGGDRMATAVATTMVNGEPRKRRRNRFAEPAPEAVAAPAAPPALAPVDEVR